MIRNMAVYSLILTLDRNASSPTCSEVANA
jgi:hypothetical protein